MSRTAPIIILFLLTCQWLIAGSVGISGRVENAEGKVIRVQRYDDLISFRRITVATDTVGPDGSFTLRFSMPATGYVSLLVDYHSAELLVQAGKDYRITVTAFSTEQNFSGRNPYLEARYLSFILEDPETHPLNLAIDSLNALYDNHLLTNFKRLSGGRRAVSTDTLADYFQRKLGFTDPFIDLSISSRVAMIEDLIRGDDRTGIFWRFIGNAPIRYDHPDYMEFFNSFFSRYITHVSRPIPFGELVYRVNEQRSYASVLDLLGRDTLLQLDVIRELVLLRNLREMYFTPDFNPEAILGILDEITRVSSVEEHRRIATNLAFRLTRMKKGTLPPPLIAITGKGDSLQPKDYRGKYVYIQFWTSECISCKADMAVMDALNNRFKDDVAFLSISTDIERAAFLASIKKETHDWPMGHSDFLSLEEYGIRTFPSYILLDRNGRILSYPARGPAEQADMVFLKLLEAEKPLPQQGNTPGTERRKE